MTAIKFLIRSVFVLLCGLSICQAYPVEQPVTCYHVQAVRPYYFSPWACFWNYMAPVVARAASTVVTTGVSMAASINPCTR